MPFRQQLSERALATCRPWPPADPGHLPTLATCRPWPPAGPGHLPAGGNDTMFRSRNRNDPVSQRETRETVGATMWQSGKTTPRKLTPRKLIVIFKSGGAETRTAESRRG
jgi:hypothetical protein